MMLEISYVLSEKSGTDRTRGASPQPQSCHADGVSWKQEPKGVITYTPESDMTIHLGVVAGVADLLTV